MSLSNLKSNNGLTALSELDIGRVSTSDIKQIGKSSDLPTAVAGVITLEDNKTYYFTRNIDLIGSRIVCGQNNVLLGTSSENSKISSTGLSQALITSQYTVVIRHVTFLNLTQVLNITGDGTTALDWYGVNFESCSSVGTIDNVANFIFRTGAFLSSGGLEFTTSADTVSFDNCLFTGSNILTLSGTITRRFRIILCSFVVFSGYGIDSSSATIPIESYILENVNFSGAGTYLVGLDESSVESLFFLNNNIENTFVNGQVYMNGNATATVIADTTNYVKVAGTTSSSTNGQKTEFSNNRITCKAGIKRKYKVDCQLSFTSGANNICYFSFYDSTLGTIRTPSITSSTANSAGRSENIGLSCIVNAVDLDYFEIWCRNSSATNNITVTDMNFIFTQL